MHDMTHKIPRGKSLFLLFFCHINEARLSENFSAFHSHDTHAGGGISIAWTFCFFPAQSIIMNQAASAHLEGLDLAALVAVLGFLANFYTIGQHRLDSLHRAHKDPRHH